MWTWDSAEITHDQTCWTYDGYNGCERQAETLLGSGGPGHYLEELWEERLGKIRQEDDDIVELIVAMVTKGII